MSEKSSKNLKQLSLPISRIKTIMKSSPEVINVSQDSAFLVAKSAELFIGYMIRESLKHKKDGTDTVQYSDLANIVVTNSRIEFLQDIIPPKITGKTYMELRKKAEEKEKRKMTIVEN